MPPTNTGENKQRGVVHTCHVRARRIGTGLEPREANYEGVSHFWRRATPSKSKEPTYAFDGSEISVLSGACMGRQQLGQTPTTIWSLTRPTRSLETTNSCLFTTRPNIPGHGRPCRRETLPSEGNQLSPPMANDPPNSEVDCRSHSLCCNHSYVAFGGNRTAAKQRLDYACHVRKGPHPQHARQPV